MSKKTPSKSLKVIGAGLGRTGTSSLFDALKKLGYTPFHMRDILQSPGPLKNKYIKLFNAFFSARRAGDKEATAAAANAVIDFILEQGFDATTDFPACHLFQEMAARFPEAPLVVGVRDNGEKWAKSVVTTIGRAGAIRRLPFCLSPGSADFAKMHAFIFEEVPGISKLEPPSWAPTYSDLARAHDLWIQYVKDNTPASSTLVVHNAKQGWEPLCKALDLPVPEEPYPHSNEGAVLQAQFDKMERIANWWWVVPVGLGIISGAAYYFVKKSK